MPTQASYRAGKSGRAFWGVYPLYEKKKERQTLGCDTPLFCSGCPYSFAAAGNSTI